MNEGRTVLAQLLDCFPKYEFDKCVARYHGNRRVRKLPAYEQFLVLAFAQLTWRESLRDIETCLAAFGPKLYHAGIRQPTARSTLADANENRDWRIFADFAHSLIRQAAMLYADEPFRLELQAAAYALDSTTIDLSLSLFPWATFRRHKAAIKLHTLLTLQGNFPTVIIVTPGSVHDVNILDQILWEAGSFYIMDRGYLDFARWHRLHQCGAFFVTRARQNFRCARRYSRRVDKTTGLRFDQTVVLTGLAAQHHYPDPLRRIGYPRSPHRQIPRVPDQQLHRARFDHRPTVSEPLADRTLLQMAQATSAHQSVLRHQSQCRAHPNLDRHRRVSARRHFEKTSASGFQPLHYFTDFEPDAL
jgi:Domain of unknown function (DUF4372)/Transposase DDE domain